MAVAIAVALFILFVPKTASAQTPAADEAAAAAAQPTTGTVELRPGANEVGWIAGAADPRVLFDEIAELESIWTWHALDRRWQAAARDVPSSLWTLYRLVPGMGLRLQIAGDDAVQWERSLAPAKGKVELQPGDNFVAWAGRDGWDVNQLAKGIGRQLREIHRRNTGTGELDRIWPVAEGAEAATVARGEALWVKMPRSIVWLQPTDVMPRLVFSSGVTENVRAAAKRDLRNTLDYFAAEYGIQADPFDFTIHVPTSLATLKTQLRAEDRTFSDIAINDIWNRSAGWAGEYVVVKYHDDAAASTVHNSSRWTMTHEYFHQVQSDIDYNCNYHFEWMVEGSAEYAVWAQQVAAGERTWQEIESDEESRMYAGVPRLASTETPNGTWEYYLGTLAVRRLVKQSRNGAWLDFYRELAPTRIGPANRWESVLSWRDVFASTFDIELDKFYAVFDHWQADLAKRNGSRLADEAFRVPARIEGRVVRADGSPIAGRFVSAPEIVLAPPRGRYRVGWTRSAETDMDGNFSVIVPNDGHYMLQIDLDDDRRCRIYYSREGGTDIWDDADLLAVSGRTMRNVKFTVPVGACLHELRGTVRGPDGEPLMGMLVSLDSMVAGTWVLTAWALTDSTGTFSVSVPQGGSYLIGIKVAEDCFVYHTDNGVTAGRDLASLVRVTGADVGIDLRVPGGVCYNTISGRLLDSSGGPMADVYVGAVSTVDQEISATRFLETHTDNSGIFRITVPQDASYRIDISLTNGCFVYYVDGGVTASHDLASLVRVAGADIDIDIHIPEGLCSTIAGRLLDASSRPMAGMEMVVESAAAYGGAIWTTTDSTGVFSFTVPQDGSYRISIELTEDCLVYYADSGVTARHDLASLVGVAGANIDIRVPEPEDACGNAIRGRLLDASGEPMTDVQLFAFADDLPVAYGAYTDSTGMFNITDLQDGSYHIKIEMAEGCDVYFASDGVTTDVNAAATVRVAGRDVQGNITVPDGWCEHTISGRLLDASGEPLVAVELATISDSRVWYPARTGSAGAFMFTVPQDGGYRIQITLPEGCHLYFASGGVTADLDAAATVRVAGRNVRGNITVPDGWCEHTISGRLLDASGEPMADVLVFMDSIAGTHLPSAPTDSAGVFSIAVAQDGGYRIGIASVEGCDLYVVGGGVTASYVRASPVHVAGGDVRVGDIRVPTGACRG